MANSVKAKDHGAVSTATANFYKKYGEAATANSIIGRLLKFNKFGEFKAGQEEEEIEHGTKLAAYMSSLCVGFQRWEDNRPADKVMGPIGQGFVPPRRSDLSHNDKSQWDTFDDGRPRDPRQFTNTLVLVDLETGDFFTFSTTSRGGLDAVGQLALKYGEHMRQKPDEMPIVELGSGSYRHSNKSYGEIRFPVLKIVDWAPLKDLPVLDAGQQLELLPGGDKSVPF
jgi:hypothetical protein